VLHSPRFTAVQRGDLVASPCPKTQNPVELISVYGVCQALSCNTQLHLTPPATGFGIACIDHRPCRHDQRPDRCRIVRAKVVSCLLLHGCSVPRASRIAML